MIRAVQQATNLVGAAVVVARRGMFNPLRPGEALRGFSDVRRYGTFGGLARHAAARYGDAPAITDEAGTLSFRQVEASSNALARGLRTHGVEPGTVVAMLGRGHHATMLTLMAANKVGARLVLMNTGFAGPQLADVCAREGVGALVADQEYLGLLDAIPEQIPRILAWSEDSPPLPAVEQLVVGHSPQPLPAPLKPGGLVLLTSGTTGTPKGAPRDRVNPLQTAQLLDRIPWPAGNTYCVAAPLFHGTGLATCSLGLALGSRVVLTRRFDPESTLAAVAEHRAATLILVPTMLQRILDLGPDVLARYDTSSLRVILAAGSALSPGLCERTLDTFGDVLYNLYGSTEVAIGAVATPAELRAAPGTVGRPPIGCALAVYDSDRRRVSEPGRTGTLFVSSGLSFSGYTDGRNKETVDGLLSTGDTGHFDCNGLWFVDGRDDDMIVSGGENVFPQEVENLLSDHPDIVEATVVGVDDPDFGKRLAAYVVKHPGSALDADAVKAHVRAHLARHKIPRDVVFVDQLPRNETGKVVKAKLGESQ